MGSRYYEDQEADIRPGKISHELREALNIAENDVPIWIYRMRALGYPPGWLSKAKVDTSDIFDTDDDVPSDGSAKKRKNAPDEGIQYDHSKFIEYPGFNAPMPEGTTDYHYYYNMPPMSDFQQLDYAKKHTSGFKTVPIPAKRYRASPTNSTDPEKSNTNPSASAKSDQSIDAFEHETPASPDPEPGDDKSREETNNLDKTTTSELSADELINRSTSSITGEIKLISKASPLPKLNERVKLERFSEGVVGDLLFHENPPNSLGNFESIRGLLNTMRRSKSEVEIKSIPTEKEDDSK